MISVNEGNPRADQSHGYQFFVGLVCASFIFERGYSRVLEKTWVRKHFRDYPVTNIHPKYTQEHTLTEIS